jgi:sulfite reductase (ferredoxin)
MGAENLGEASQGKVSKVEGFKAASHRLRGGIAEELRAPSTAFAESDHQLLKFHGIYQGYDRDSATELKQAGEGKRTEFMARIKAPAGLMSADQYLAVDKLAQAYSQGRLRITTRQGLQFHGVAKRDLWATIHGVNQALLTTFGACGDVARNVTATAAPIEDAVHRRIRADAVKISNALFPQTRAYHEIWVGDEAIQPAPTDEPAVDPLYGPTYLPRKFKIGITVPEDNSIEVLTNDLGIIALFDGDVLQGYVFAVGGGLGMTHNKAHTYPRLGSYVAFIEPDDLLDAVKAVLKVHRDWSDRADRKHARLKYVVDAMGLPRVKAEMERHLGKSLEDPRPFPALRIKDHSGWHAQGDGKFYYGLPVLSGRIEDKGKVRMATALRRVLSEVRSRPVFTPSQDVIFADVEAADKARLEAILEEEGVTLPGAETLLRRFALACPALPSCGLALTEAERVLDDILQDIEGVLHRHGLAGERLALRVTGCPNGCARPSVGDIGLVGRIPGHYAIYLGGDFDTTRLNARVFERVPMAEIGRTLEPVFALYAAERNAGEGFGDFCRRWGLDRLAATAENGVAADAAE